MRCWSVFAQLTALAGLAVVTACSATARPVRPGDPDPASESPFAAAARWVVQQDSLPARVDPRPMAPGPGWDEELAVLPSADPEVVRQRRQVLSGLTIPTTDAERAVGCIGTSGLGANLEGPITGYCASLFSYRAALVSMPWSQGSDASIQLVRVVIVINSGFDAYDLTARYDYREGWRIVHAELIYNVRS